MASGPEPPDPDPEPESGAAAARPRSPGDRPTHRDRPLDPEGQDVVRSLYEAYHQSIVSLFCRMRFTREEARELAQETFVRVSRGMPQYRGEARKAFLEVTARNLALNEIRKRRTTKREHQSVPLEETVEPPTQDPWVNQVDGTPEATLLAKERAIRRRQRLYNAVARLPDGMRHCFLLRLGGLQYDEIAGAMQITMDAVKGRLHEARRQIERMLRDESEGLSRPATAAEEKP